MTEQTRPAENNIPTANEEKKQEVSKPSENPKTESEQKGQKEKSAANEPFSKDGKGELESEVEANLMADKQALAKTLEDSTKPKSEETGIKKDKEETIEDVQKMLADIDEKIKKGKEKIPMTEHDMKSFVDWCLGSNRFLANNDENDLPKTESTDQMASELSSWIFGRLAGTGIGMALISTGVLSWLGIFIIGYSNTPNSVATSLKKYIGGETLGLIPLSKIPNFSEKLAGYANGTNARVAKKLKDLEYARFGYFEDEKKRLEQKLVNMQKEGAKKQETNKTKPVEEKKASSDTTPKGKDETKSEASQEKKDSNQPEKKSTSPLSACGSSVDPTTEKKNFTEDNAKKNGKSLDKKTSSQSHKDALNSKKRSADISSDSRQIGC